MTLVLLFGKFLFWVSLRGTLLNVYTVSLPESASALAILVGSITVAMTLAACRFHERRD